MATINDTAGIFVGPVLEAFNQMEFVVARDGDTAFAQVEMMAAMQRVTTNTQPGAIAGTTGRTIKRR